MAQNQDLKAAGLFDVSHVTVSRTPAPSVSKHRILLTLHRSLQAVVTGGATGIGLMITQALVSNGAKVYITSRRQEVLDNAVSKYNTGPGSLQSLTGDVSTKEGAIQLAKELGQKEPKGIQLLVNNAGIARDDDTKFCKSSRKILRQDSYRITRTDSVQLPMTVRLTLTLQKPSPNTFCAQKMSSSPRPTRPTLQANTL